MGLPLAELKQKVIDNVEQLDKLADDVDNKELGQLNLVQARNLFLKRKVSAQKLALAVLNVN